MTSEQGLDMTYGSICFSLKTLIVTLFCSSLTSIGHTVWRQSTKDDYRHIIAQQVRSALIWHCPLASKQHSNDLVICQDVR